MKILKKRFNLMACCLMLFAFAGSAVAQNDPLHVIKKGNHYLAHVITVQTADTTIWEVQDAETFSPDCLWHSGNTANVYGLHHNYYFIDGYGNYRFLSAPLEANGTLSLSTSLPSIQLLRNTDQVYYFYDWDPDQYGGGVARGHKYQEVTNMNACSHSWSHPETPESGECWEVYWVEYIEGETHPWKLSATSSYNITPNGSRYRPVTATEYPMVVSNEEGGLNNLTLTEEMEYGFHQVLSITPTFPFGCDYISAYTHYVFEGTDHYYYNNTDNTSAPESTHGTATSIESYEWTISGDGGYYLSFDETEHYTSSDEVSPTLYYNRSNNQGDQTAIISVTVTYNNGVIQTRSASINVKVVCGNPGESANPVVTYEGVTISWYPTSDRYKVYWTTDNNSWSNNVEVGNVTSYTFTGLAQNTKYYYKVVAYTCDNLENATAYHFTTKGEPGLVVYGAVFGGGRMADVDGKTQVAIINCDSIHAVYGGNDIAGVVQGTDGSIVTLGVAANDPNDFDDYGTTNGKIRIGDVYGGGNGYYAYNGTSFEAASYDTEYHVANGASIMAMTQLNHVGEAVWTNTTGSVKDLVCPTITKTNITVTNDYVKIDSLFGGAKNAILNATSNDVTITINGGTLYSVFGGNNFGGSLGYKSQESIEVNHTTVKTGDDYHTTTIGRDFGIGYLFGGGNKVQGQNVTVTVNGGQLDTIFGGGNQADVRSTEVKIQCALGALANGAYGQVYSEAINSYNNDGTFTINGSYAWDRSSIYNVRTLFGGNNRAPMECVPNLTLISGSIGTVYGGGNMGDMLAEQSATIEFEDLDDFDFNYSTHVQMNSTKILIDYLYGGCQKSNVDYSTWVEIMNGHVGTVYGGCNISGDVGSARVNPNVPSNPPSEAYQTVQGGSYVKASGGIVYKNLFAGSNGFYHCNNGVAYIEGVNYSDPENYVGWAIPTHNETHAIITGGVQVKGNVYAGGNMSPVGFTDATVGDRSFPQFVGLASLRMDGGEVLGNVFGGGNMASILGGNEVRVFGGYIGGALYGGNDRSGQAGQISNRVMPAGYNIASDQYTSLTGVNTYVKVTGNPIINTVYGGGNGDYDYDHGDLVIQEGEYCSYDENGKFNDKPIQTNTFVDINIDGDAADGGHINTVYGGGNGVTVTGSITVFLNVKDAEYGHDHVDTIFGGNNKDNVVESNNAPLVPDIILLQGQVGTVYGGCNKGAMATAKNFTIGGNTYKNIGSMVRLRSTYPGVNGDVTPTAVVSQAVYGGCCMNDVTHNSLVLVEGGAAVPAKLFGGCDISGAVGDTARVVVTGGNVNGDIFGGGNGYYYYKEVQNTGVSGVHYEVYTDENETQKLTDSVSGAPVCRVSRVDILDGQVGADATHTANVFGGGYGQPTNTSGNVIVNVGLENASSSDDCPVLYGDVYGGSALGTVNTNTSNLTTVTFANGTITGNIYGGGLGNAPLNSNGYINTTSTDPTIKAFVNGSVQVNIGTANQSSNFVNINGKVFGGNNLAGTPKGNINVDVYHTAHTTENTYSVTSPDLLTNAYFEDDTHYAFNEVYGGGNLAHYEPTLENAKADVHVHYCENTIKYVYGGGNAADVTSSSVTIDGGLVKYVFGGGNGEGNGNPGANVGSSSAGGDNALAMNGGAVAYMFGGSNTKGTVYGETTMTFAEEPTCPIRSVNELYGGGNRANEEDGVTFTIPCGAKGVKYLYGGSKQADVGTAEAPAHIVLNVEGGDNLLEVYGGNNISGTIYGNVTLNLKGGTIGKAFGGNNVGGDITGSIQVNVIEDSNCPLHVDYVYGGGNLAKYEPSYTPTSGTERISPEVNVKNGTVNAAVFGGGLGASAKVYASPKVTIGDNSNENYKAIVGALLNGSTTEEGEGYVFGGGDMADVIGNTLVIYNDENTDSHVNNIFGGGNRANIGGVVNEANEGGIITVNMNNGNVLNTIYGGCNELGVVSDTITVTVNGGTTGSVVGGGNLVAYEAPINTPDYPYVHIVDGIVTDKVVGGGNQAGVKGNPRIFIEGGTIGTSTSDESAGVYGGCNIDGTVEGNTTVTLIGGTVGESTTNKANIHGGGYGQSTNVTGNVLVIFGQVIIDDNTNKETHTIQPLLYGDLYGGSALGDVNTNAENTTTVNLLNGTINGAAYGGGLGQKTGFNNATSDIEALVNGKVYVNVGRNAANATDVYRGQANLSNCDVYGCNNLNGSPQDVVRVDVYQTYQTESDSSNYYNNATYAIHQVFGGGNRSDFTIENKKCYVYVHKCLNTIERVFGGGDAAAVWGTDLTIDGGRFDQVFGGGNGEVTHADITGGGINILIGGGHITLLVNGSNDSGTVTGGIVSNTMNPPVCDDAVVTDYFMGNNQTDYFGDIEANVWCGEGNPVEMKFVNLYCGSNRAQIYGNIILHMEGGVFENVFGGSKGRRDNPETTEDESFASNIYIVTQGMIDTIPELHQHPEYLGNGGNITLYINGGTIGNLFGGCDQNGNVEGKITIEVELDENSDCPAFIGNIFGAGNFTDYTPVKAEIANGSICSPEIKIIKGTIGGQVPVKNGVGLLPIYNPGSIPAVYEGNVYGGGNYGNVTSSPKVIIGNGTNSNIQGNH